MDIPVELSRVVITEMGDQQVIFLREKGGERSFPILIGIAEALAIDRRLKGVETPRPMTHDLLASVIETMGGEVEKIVVSDIREHTFIATLYVRRDGELLEIDARPSDAIALGAGLETPLYVARKVFDNVLSPPSSREDRIELLRTRMQMLARGIDELESLLENPQFLANAPEQAVEQQRERLEEMRTEHEAIREVLAKLG
jgi:hypothetical protein